MTLRVCEGGGAAAAKGVPGLRRANDTWWRLHTRMCAHAAPPACFACVMPCTLQRCKGGVEQRTVAPACPTRTGSNSGGPIAQNRREAVAEPLLTPEIETIAWLSHDKACALARAKKRWEDCPPAQGSASARAVRGSLTMPLCGKQLQRGRWRPCGWRLQPCWRPCCWAPCRRRHRRSRRRHPRHPPRRCWCGAKRCRPLRSGS